MIEQVNGFITPMKGWDAVEKNDKKKQVVLLLPKN